MIVTPSKAHWTSKNALKVFKRSSTAWRAGDQFISSNDSKLKCIMTARISDSSLSRLSRLILILSLVPEQRWAPLAKADDNHHLKRKDIWMMTAGAALQTLRGWNSRPQRSTCRCGPWQLCFRTSLSSLAGYKKNSLNSTYICILRFSLWNKKTNFWVPPPPPTHIMLWLWPKGYSQCRMSKTSGVGKKKMSSSTQEPFLSDLKRTFSPWAKKRFWWGLTFVYQSASFALWYLW